MNDMSNLYLVDQKAYFSFIARCFGTKTRILKIKFLNNNYSKNMLAFKIADITLEPGFML